MRPWARLSRSDRKTRSSRWATGSWFPSRSPAGECFFCKNGFFFRLRNARIPITRWPKNSGATRLRACSAISHMLGGYAGGQAEYLRVPYADVGPIKVPQGLSDEQVLFLSDIFPTGFMAADFCNLKGGETVAVWGCGPVGQFAIKSAFLLGAERVIAIDTVPERLALAQASGAVTLDFKKEDIYDRIQELTNGARCGRLHRRGRYRAGHRLRFRRGRRPHQGCDLHGNRPSACAAAGHSLLPQLRNRVDRRCSMAVCSTTFPWVRRSNRGLTFRMAQTPVQHTCRSFWERIEKGPDRPILRNHPSRDAGGRTRALQDVPRQAGRLHQGRDEAMKPIMARVLIAHPAGIMISWRGPRRSSD